MNNTLFFIEDSYIIFSYKFDLEEKITRFKVNLPNSYYIYTKSKKIKGQMNLYCCLNEKNFILNILKYMKYEYNENIYYELLSILFKKNMINLKKII